MTDFIVAVTFLGLAIYAIVYDASNSNIGWLLMDILSPLGPFRGLYLLFFA